MATATYDSRRRIPIAFNNRQSSSGGIWTCFWVRLYGSSSSLLLSWVGGSMHSNFRIDTHTSPKTLSLRLDLSAVIFSMIFGILSMYSVFQSSGKQRSIELTNCRICLKWWAADPAIGGMYRLSPKTILGFFLPLSPESVSHAQGWAKLDERMTGRGVVVVVDTSVISIAPSLWPARGAQSAWWALSWGLEFETSQMGVSYNSIFLRSLSPSNITHHVLCL